VIDEREIVRRAAETLTPPEPSFERLLRRRDRVQRNRKVAAAGFALILTAVGIGVVVTLTLNRAPVPAEPADVRNGDLAFVGDGNLHLVDPSTGQTRILVRSCPAIDETCAARIVSADWSPDGTRIAYAIETERGAGGAAGIYVLDMGSRETALLTSCSDPCWSQTELDWSPDGTRIAYTQHAGGMCTAAAGFDGRCGIFIVGVDGSAPVELRTGFLIDPVDPSWSPDGLEIAFTAQGVGAVTTPLQPAEWTVYRMGTDGSGPVPLTTMQRFLAAPAKPAWSPDGSLIAFVVTDAPSYYNELWTMAPDGSDLTFVADLGCCTGGGGLANDPSPEWSPDGTRIAVTVESSYLGILDRDGNEVADLGEDWWAYPSWRPIS
jgi:Tol biopolymer transport system component